jgi:CO/xanthine dehydrogenase FAD-binding subunit
MINPHPGLPEFEYIKPASLVEASQFLAEHEGDVRPFAGGTDNFVRLRDGVLKLKYLVDVKGLPFDPQKGLTIGSGVTMNQVSTHKDVITRYPCLAEAAGSVASYQLRNRATVIGNICNASPAGDTIGACIALDGVLNVHGVSGMRQIPLSNFYLGPGKTVLKPGDLVVSIYLPILPNDSTGVYKKLGRNSIGDLSIVGVTVLGYPSSDSPSGFRFRIVLASVAPVPFEAFKAEAVLAQKKITDDVISEAARVAMESVTPIDDVRSSARYRKYMVRNLTREALTEVWTKIGKP